MNSQILAALSLPASAFEGNDMGPDMSVDSKATQKLYLQEYVASPKKQQASLLGEYTSSPAADFVDKENGLDASFEGSPRRTPTRKMNNRTNTLSHTERASPLHWKEQSASKLSHLRRSQAPMSPLHSHVSFGNDATPGNNKSSSAMDLLLQNMESQLQAVENTTPARFKSTPGPAVPEDSDWLRLQVESLRAEVAAGAADKRILESRLEMLESQGQSQRQTLLGLTSQIGEKVEVIASLEEAVARLTAELDARPAVPLSQEPVVDTAAWEAVKGLQSELTAVQKNYFFASALALKMDHALFARGSSNSIDAQALYEACIAAGVPTSDWPAWIRQATQ